MLKDFPSSASQHESERPLAQTKPRAGKKVRPLSGKTALVTGSTSGIGLGIAKALVAQGANLVMNGFGDVDLARTELTALAKKNKSNT